ncbi:MAG: gamma-glutamyltransferase [Planctomycetota bacterium]|jgi:gamma-glutamyltranspeptidase/glutathione hydrolase
MGLAVAAGTGLAAETARIVADLGGNAVDAAIAATFVTWVCEPGLTSMGSGGYVSVWAPGELPITVDGFVEMPGRSAAPERFGLGDEVNLDYGGGTRTVVGPGSVATPGSLAAVELAWKRWGTVPWPELVRPAVEIAARGFPVPVVSNLYFRSSGRPIFDRSDGGRRLWVGDDGEPRPAGSTMTMPELADALRAVADDGARALYAGDIGRRIAEWFTDHGGLLGRDDLEAYEPKIRPCLVTHDARWHLATNPPPAVGGVVLFELASMMGPRPVERWSAAEVALFARVMRIAFTDRLQLLQEPDVAAAAETFLGEHIDRQRERLRTSGSTSHTSAVDSSGLACSITTSTGYSSGIMVPGTGIMLNNMLGEIELNPGGLHHAKPGTRLRSNMAPSVARSDAGDVIAFGAAGADRIASALAQVWLNPRCHFEWRGGEPTLAHEPGIDLTEVALPTYAFDDLHMFFGGVQAAQRDAAGRLHAVADPRRAGGAVMI